MAVEYCDIIAKDVNLQPISERQLLGSFKKNTNFFSDIKNKKIKTIETNYQY